MRETPGGDIHFSSSKLSLKETSNWARIGHGALKEKEMKTCIYLIDKRILLMSFVNCLYCFGISEMQNLANWENASLHLLLLKSSMACGNHWDWVFSFVVWRQSASCWDVIKRNEWLRQKRSLFCIWQLLLLWWWMLLLENKRRYKLMLEKNFLRNLARTVEETLLQ